MYRSPCSTPVFEWLKVVGYAVGLGNVWVRFGHNIWSVNWLLLNFLFLFRSAFRTWYFGLGLLWQSSRELIEPVQYLKGLLERRRRIYHYISIPSSHSWCTNILSRSCNRSIFGSRAHARFLQDDVSLSAWFSVSKVLQQNGFCLKTFLPRPRLRRSRH